MIKNPDSTPSALSSGRAPIHLPRLTSVSVMGKNLSKFVRFVQEEDAWVYITVNGKPVAALLPVSVVQHL